MNGTAKYSSFAHTGMKSMKMVGSLSLETLKQVLIDHFLGIIYEYIQPLWASIGCSFVAITKNLNRESLHQKEGHGQESKTSPQHHHVHIFHPLLHVCFSSWREPPLLLSFHGRMWTPNLHRFFCLTGQLPKLITYARFSGSHKSNFLLLELCLFQLQSKPFECGKDQGSTVLTLSFLE